MKLMRVGPPGRERPAMLSDGTIRDLSGEVEDIAGDVLSDEGLDRLRALDPSTLPEMASGRIGPCVGRVGKMVCIGLNYSDHAAETGAKVPEEPILFMKATTAICGPDDEVLIPRGSREDRLGGRARRGGRPGGPLRRGG